MSGNSGGIREASYLLVCSRTRTDEVGLESGACGAVVEHDSGGVLVAHQQGRARHLRVHVAHLQVDVVNAVQKVAQEPAAHLPAYIPVVE